MNILITGANGFIGKNLVATLKQNKEHNLFLYTKESTEENFNEYAKKADFVFHLAGVNRPKNQNEFYEGNVDLTEKLIGKLIDCDNIVPVLISSSIQATFDNPYGKSKKLAEDIVFKYGKENNIDTYVFRLPNLFGKWSKPNYNSVVATFCHNVARDIEISVSNPNTELTIAYIDDVVETFVDTMCGQESKEGKFNIIPLTYTVSLEEITKLLYSFKESRTNRLIPNLADTFTKKLYSTYLNFLPENAFSYPLIMHEDDRGHFTEFVKSSYAGQVSINVSKPGVSKGEHWHHTKNEKFLVVSGDGLIRFRDPYSDVVIEYTVSGSRLEVVDIPPGYTHSIVNIGDTDMVTVMWVNEMFDPHNPDTYYLEV